MAAYAILSAPKIKEYLDAGDDVVIESLYSWQEYLKVKEEFADNFFVIAIYASPKIRHERIVSRVEIKNGSQRRITKEEAILRDKVQLEATPPAAQLPWRTLLF